MATTPTNTHGDSRDAAQTHSRPAERVEHLLDMLDAAHDLFASVEPDGSLRFVNGAGRALLGIPSDADVRGLSVAAFHPQHALDAILGRALPYAAAHGRWEGETSFVSAGGRAFLAWQAIVAHQRADGTLSHYSTIVRDLSERREAEAAIHASEERLRRALSAARQGLYDLNIQTGEAVVTSEYATMLGYEPSSFHETNARWIERLHPDDVERVAKVYSDYMAGRLSEYRVEFRQRTAAGDWKWILSLGQIVARDSQGQPLRMLGTHTDITERKQAEIALQQLNQELEQRVERRTAALRRSEAHLLTAQRIAALGSWEFDIASGAISWSTEIYRIFERDPQLGPPGFDELHEYFHPDDRDRHRAVVAQALEEAQPYQIELRVQLGGGRMRNIQARGELIRDEAGRLAGLLGTILDITDRKAAEAEQRNLSDRLTLAARSASLGIWDWDIVHDVLTWDQRMYELYGVRPDMFSSVYDAWASGLHPEDRAAGEEAIQLALRGEREFDTEFRVVHPSGEIRTIKAHGLVQRDGAGRALRMIGVNFDITERKRAELQQRETRAQLEAANHELQAFAYSVSHDLRAPLRAIDGFSLAIEEEYGERLDDTARDYLRRVRGGVQRMGQLIDDLLRLSRVTRAEMQLDKVNLSALVAQIAGDLRARHPGRRVELTIESNLVARADASLLQVALTNLIGNAWKFTGGREPALIAFGRTMAEGRTVYFVRDNGAGFDMAYAHKLFGVFQRLHDTNEYPGTGIGLATVQRVIARHGGAVWAEGAVGKGAAFFFTLPT